MNKEVLQNLDTLTQLQILTPKGRKSILTLMELLEQEYGIVFSERQAGMFIAHLAESFRRIDGGEVVDSMGMDAAGQLQNFTGLGIAEQMLRDITTVTGIHFPNNEAEYLKMYLCTLLANR